jgi:hypothetical protein
MQVIAQPQMLTSSVQDWLVKPKQPMRSGQTQESRAATMHSQLTSRVVPSAATPSTQLNRSLGAQSA